MHLAAMNGHHQVSSENVITIHNQKTMTTPQLHDSIVVSIPACHAGDRGSIPRRGVSFLFFRFRQWSISLD